MGVFIDSMDAPKAALVQSNLVSLRVRFGAFSEVSNHAEALVPLKIAYEIAALAFDSPVLADLPPQREMRRRSYGSYGGPY